MALLWLTQPWGAAAQSSALGSPLPPAPPASEAPQAPPPPADSEEGAGHAGRGQGGDQGPPRTPPAPSRVELPGPIPPPPSTSSPPPPPAPSGAPQLPPPPPAPVYPSPVAPVSPPLPPYPPAQAPAPVYPYPAYAPLPDPRIEQRRRIQQARRRARERTRLFGRVALFATDPRGVGDALGLNVDMGLSRHLLRKLGVQARVNVGLGYVQAGDTIRGRSAGIFELSVQGGVVIGPFGPFYVEVGPFVGGLFETLEAVELGSFIAGGAFGLGLLLGPRHNLDLMLPHFYIGFQSEGSEPTLPGDSAYVALRLIGFGVAL